MVNFIYPNEAEILWSILIILYPFFSGLVAGSYIVSVLYYVFNIPQLKSISKFSLLTVLSFLIILPIPVALHLGQPLRGIEILTTPQSGSAMSGFGIIYITFLIIMISQLWFEFRKDIISYAESNKGLKKLFYNILSLGSLDKNEQDFATDKKIMKTLSAIGIPVSIILTGYVGFLFGGIKASPWWATPLMPVIFIMSGFVSGTSLLFLLFVVSNKIRHRQQDHAANHILLKWIFGFLFVDVSFELLELIYMRYESMDSWPYVLILLTEKIPIPYFGLQLIAGGIIPLILIGLLLLFKAKSNIKINIGTLSSILILIGVFAMRYSVVIGGQLLSKSNRGFAEYHPELWGREGLLIAVVIMIIPYIILVTLINILPPWEDTAPKIKK